ncbi:Phox homologous domain [Phytophthora cactorum]|nr:Phox homologous domain [Phytophthora cactorum]
MEPPECLHRGELWQFSAQYGGWLAIKLLLFSHALVVDPDADTGTPRRRRNSLKLWMDLCLVKDITKVHKEATLQFATATTEQRDEWLHCLSLAIKLHATHEMKEAFLRFASSGSEDSEEENRLSSPTSWSEENALRVSTIVPVSEASQESVSVGQVKLDAIRRCKLGYDDSFVLYLDIGDQWLQDEQQSIGHYILGCASRKIELELVPMHRMPQPTLDLAIVGTKTKISDLSQRPYTCYVIDVVFNGTTWQLARRYKEFDALHSQLKSKYPGTALPGLPPKHVFTPVEGEFINYRKEQLEAFLKQLLLHPIASTDVLLMSFLGVVSISRDPELGQREKSVIHVTSLHDSVGVGDIILFSCRFGASRLQRKFTGSKYDHVGIVVPGESRFLLRIMEATSEGIQVYSLKPRLMAYAREVSNTIIVRKIVSDRTPELTEMLREFVRRVDGNPYSIFGILRSTGESDRNIFNSVRVGNSVGEESDDSFFNTGGSSTSSTPSSPEGLTLPTSAWKELGWLQTKRKASSFWPGSFEDGGEVERLLAPSVALGPETVIDCRIVEVGLSAQC